MESLTKQKFLTKACKLIAENKVKGNARNLLMQLAVNGFCRPVVARSQSYSDNTASLLDALKQMECPECLPSKRGNYFAEGWYIQNDAPRGGKLGTIVKVNFALR